MPPKILIVDDIPANANVLRQLLEPQGYEILIATDGRTALEIAHRAKPDLILLDVVMDDMDGFETCQRLKADAALAEIPVLFITIKDEPQSIARGFEVGGVDYITKPFHEEEVLARVKTHLRIKQLITELQDEIAHRKVITNERNHLSNRLDMLADQEATRWGMNQIVGQSQTIRRILERIQRLHNTDTTVLIQGESGTGKELIARAIHLASSRVKGPFIPVNCTAIPAELAESELFGHVRGAFTGATANRKGHFELADGGTLFLDEIGDMPQSLQAKLLRVLEDLYILPVGGTTGVQVDVRIVAATNANLAEKINDGVFRQDLYYRLAQFQVVLPPLRERREDIPILCEHFLQMFSAEMGRSAPEISPQALTALETHPFPGNIRELKHLIEGALLECDGAQILPEHLRFLTPPAVSSPANAQPPPEIPLNLEQAEIFLIKSALKQAQGNVSEAARLLGVTRATVYRKLARAGIDESEVMRET